MSGLEVSSNAQIYGARLQTYLRLRQVPNAYEILRQFTQNKKLDKQDLYTEMKKYFSSEWWTDLSTLLDLSPEEIHINTSNKKKQREFEDFFKNFGFTADVLIIWDIDEPVATQEDIVTYKASKLGSAAYKILV